MSTLFDNGLRPPQVQGTGYGSAAKARKTLRLIRHKPAAYQKQIITTMYYRAKHHKFQTPGMRAAMRVFAKTLHRKRE